MPCPALLAMMFLAAHAEAQVVPIAVVPSGMLMHMGGVRSISVPLVSKQPSSITRPPAGAKQIRYGTLNIFGQRFVVALAQTATGQKLFVDANQDGDLSDDPPCRWSVAKAPGNSSGEAHLGLRIGKRRSNVRIVVALTGAKQLTVIPDFGFQGRVKLGGASVRFFLADGAGRGFINGDPSACVLGLDRRADGVINGVAEQFDGSKPFTVSGTSLVIKAVNLSSRQVAFDPAESVPEIPLPVRYEIGHIGPSFTATDLNGKVVSFPTNYTEKLVLLFAWATWSPPSVELEGRIAKLYATYRGQGFDVLAISLNRDSEVAALRSAPQRGWRQVSDGKSWQGDVVRSLGITTLPFALLVDGRSAKVVATMNELTADRLDATIRANLPRQGD